MSGPMDRTYLGNYPMDIFLKSAVVTLTGTAVDFLIIVDC